MWRCRPDHRGRGRDRGPRGLAFLAGPGASPSPRASAAGGATRRHRTAADRSVRVGAVPAPVHVQDRGPGLDGQSRPAKVLGLLRDAAPRGSLFFLRVDEVIKSPCVQGGEGTQTGSGAADVLTQIEALDHLDVANHKAVQVGGLTGQQVDITVADGVLAACGGLAGGEAAIFRAGDEVWGAASGERFRLISIGVGDQAVTILLSTDWTQTPSVQELENMLRARPARPRQREVLRAPDKMAARAPVAQWIERRPPEPKVAGSNPVGRAIPTASRRRRLPDQAAATACIAPSRGATAAARSSTSASVAASRSRPSRGARGGSRRAAGRGTARPAASSPSGGDEARAREDLEERGDARRRGRRGRRARSRRRVPTAADRRARSSAS